MLEIPAAFWHVPYVDARIPGVPEPEDLAARANCQLFAYQLLRYHGKHVPDFRSSELWTDDTYTMRVTSFEPLDLMLYNRTPEPWGAHVGVYVGDDQVIHLSKEIGRPVLFRCAEFATHARYACFIGAKRVR